MPTKIQPLDKFSKNKITHCEVLISPKSVYRAIKDLLNRRLILIVEHHRSKGTKYRVDTPGVDT